MRKKSVRPKKYLIIIFVLITLLFFALAPSCVIADDQTLDYVADLYSSTYDQMNDIDYSALEDIVDGLESDNIFSGSFYDTVKGIVDGTFDIDAENLLEYLFQVIGLNIRAILPLGIVVICIAIIVRFLRSFTPASFKNGILEIINFVAIGVVVIYISKYIIDINSIVFSSITTMQNILNAIFPILMTLMGVLGASSSVAIYSPITSILNTGISSVMTNFLYPIYILSFSLIIISSITSKVRLDKLITFLSSLFKTSLAFVFGIFSSVFVIKGISAGKFDSVSIYTTKFAVKNYVPLIGSYISEGFNYLLLSTMLIKNAIGLAGIILVLCSILSPVIYLMLIRLFFHFVSSIVDMIGCKEISDVLQRLSKIMSFPLAIILGVAFMFIMSISLVVCTANLV